jgi:hypothetical protein
MKLAKFTLKESAAALCHRREESHIISMAAVESQGVHGRFVSVEVAPRKVFP